MPEILPTHSCFDDALEFLATLARDNLLFAETRLRLVHGICRAPDGPRAGELFAHGWIELDQTIVIQAGLFDGKKGYYGIRRADHYRQLRVQVTTTYTVRDAYEKNREFHNYGPWEPTYRALCNTGARVVFCAEGYHA